MFKIVSQNLRYVFENVRKRDPASSSIFQGGVETGSMYVQYVQGIKPNVPASTTFIELSKATKPPGDLRKL